MNNLITTFFYLGRLPIAPGTWGSMGALLVWCLIPVNFLLRILILTVTCIIGYIACEAVLKESDDSDPSYIVIDEVIGLWLALLFIPKSLFLFILGFSLFRIFDILKPSFIYQSQFMPGAKGVMVDDILAGAFTLIILLGVMA